MDAEPARKTSFTFELTNDQQELLLGLMVTGNYRKREVPYALCSVEGDHFNATLYQKEKHGRRKLCVQGSKAEDFVLFQLEPRGIVPVGLGYEQVLNPEIFSSHAGSDESGKGDYFGPLVVCCVYVDEAIVEAMGKLTYLDGQDRVRKLEVKDCKAYADDGQILAAGAALRKLLGPTGHSVVKLGPAAYNRLYARMKNINRMLAWAHGTAIEDLLTKRPGCKRVVVDQFARIPMTDAGGAPVTDEFGHVREDVERSQAVLKRALKERGKAATVEQRHKAESDIAVAAASVIARELFLRSIMEMERSCASLTSGEDTDSPLPSDTKRGEAVSSPLVKKEPFHIPIGSSDPRVRELAVEMVRKHGPVWLMNHCKAHFQTTDKVLAACGKSRADLPPEGQVASAAQRSSEGGRPSVARRPKVSGSAVAR